MRYLSVFVLLCACGDNSRTDGPETLGPVTDPIEWVDPTIGTGGFGFAYGSAFVGAAAPHGLIKLGPDTRGEFGTIGFQHYSGYYAGDDVIESFSHLHLHGAGLADYGAIGVMPTTELDETNISLSAYWSQFDKADELAAPGLYKVRLSPSDVAVELTATTRAAHHRYTFPDQAEPAVVIDLSRALEGGDASNFEISVDAEARSLSGSLTHSGQMSNNYGGYRLHFAARTKEAWQSDVRGESGIALRFAAGQEVELQLAVSLVSVEGAWANLESEMPVASGWDFERTVLATQAAWRKQLETILVEGGTRKQRRIFYTALYHSFLMPTITSDVDGQYVYAGETKRIENGEFLSDLSLWDTYRTLHPLYHLLSGTRGEDALRSLVAMNEAGQGFPRWPIAAGESGTMLGASADVVLADGIIKLGTSETVDGLDAAAVLAELARIALEPGLDATERGGRNPADDYIELGFVSSDSGRSVSTQLEYAVDDFALANLSMVLANDELAAVFDARQYSHRELFDPATKTFRPRERGGAFPSAEGYDPLDFGEEFAEANAMQMLWAPIHDARGLAELLGGDDAFIATLSEFFDSAASDLVANPLDELLANAVPRPHYWHGNEPDIHAAYLFGQRGRDDLTQRWLTWIREQLYADTASGLAGNDDSGTLSSWYVWSAMGIYPVAGSDRYFVGMPLFPKMMIQTRRGTLVIEAPSDGPIAGVSGLTVNGERIERAEVRHADLVGTIRFDVTSAPTRWSTAD